MVRCRYLLWRSLPATGFAVAVACGGDDIIDPCGPGAERAEPRAPLSIGIDWVSPLPDPFPIVQGNSIRLMAIEVPFGECGAGVPENQRQLVTWTSSDTGTATVYPNGVVHTHYAGEVTVSAAVGSATATQRLLIVALGTVPRFETLVAGPAQSCAIGTEGTLYCWGAGIPSLCAAIGVGYTCASDYTTGPLASDEYPNDGWATCAPDPPHNWLVPNRSTSDRPCSRVPSPYALGAALANVDANDSQVCGVTAASALYCAPTAGPLRLLGVGFTTVALGSNHACALNVSGRAYCWGSSAHGALGDSTLGYHHDPQPVHGDHRFTAIESAGNVSCALATDGRAYCWGASVVGQESSAAPERCGGFRALACSLIPRAISDTSFVQLAVGGEDAHACGLTADGTAYCWGGNYEGKLGDGTKEWRCEPTPVGGSLRFQSISAGSSHTCGITTDGVPYCWGSNLSGQLGHPGITAALLPVPVTGAPALKAIKTGGAHTCGLGTDGAVFCWGWNGNGQLGNGTLPDQHTPTRIAGQD